MVATLILCLPLDWLRPGNPPRPPGPFPGLPALPDELSPDKFLERHRRGTDVIEACLKMWEGHLPDIYTPEGASLMRQRLERYRDEVEKSRRWERELERWAAQQKLRPGRETDAAAIDRLERLYQELWGPPAVAPMPREKK